MDIEAEAKKLLLENRRTTDGNQYTIPSADHYPYQWLWDSCFHAIILAKFEPAAAKAEIIRQMLPRIRDDVLHTELRSRLATLESAVTKT